MTKKQLRARLIAEEHSHYHLGVSPYVATTCDFSPSSVIFTNRLKNARVQFRPSTVSLVSPEAVCVQE
ncbi:MAG TPA: hypothetical protein VEW46_08000 [Pyrinomonadaceae bacterium]|nr:hypothetical protein [Pyrinomonadaceae bacterium]